MSEEIKTVLYLIVGFVDVLVYIPLIYTILKNPYEAIKSNNYYTWMWWALSGFVIVIYMTTVLNDIPTIIISTLNFLSCLVIFLILTVYKIKSKKEKNLSSD